MTPLGVMLWLAAMVAAIHFAIWPGAKERWERNQRASNQRFTNETREQDEHED